LVVEELRASVQCGVFEFVSFNGPCSEISRVEVSCYIVPLVRGRRDSNAFHPVADVDIEAFGLIADIAENDSTI
jgi:hypothetical protein